MSQGDQEQTQSQETGGKFRTALQLRTITIHDAGKEITTQIYCSPSQLGQGEIIRGRESTRLLAYVSGKGVKTSFSYKRSHKICREGDPPSRDSFLPY